MFNHRTPPAEAETRTCTLWLRHDAVKTVRQHARIVLDKMKCVINGHRGEDRVPIAQIIAGFDAEFAPALSEETQMQAAVRQEGPTPAVWRNGQRGFCNHRDGAAAAS